MILRGAAGGWHAWAESCGKPTLAVLDGSADERLAKLHARAAAASSAVAALSLAQK